VSHFTTVQTKIRDLVCLKAALADLNLAFTEAEAGQQVVVRGYQGQTQDAQMSIRASKTYDVGVVVTEQGVELVADWWGVETTLGQTQEEFTRLVTQRYAYHKVKKEVEARGYKLDMVEEEQAAQTITVKVSKWS
jgi:hypothetical protein